MMFTATKLQTATYLLGVCLFSISFLVFLNSSISFVVTDLIKLPTGEGDAVGTLGFADELLALVACPVWGMLSDRIGVRYVCTVGYLIIALALALFVQAKNVYPELLLGRLLFSLGGSAVTTMVTAVLPAMTASRSPLDGTSIISDQSSVITARPPPLDGSQGIYGHTPRPSNASELTITPVLYQATFPGSKTCEKRPEKDSTSYLAGIVGMLTGCGAVVALLVFLPLPAWFEKSGRSPTQSIKLSYYVVALLSLVISAVCFIGLRDLPDDQYTEWRSPFRYPREHTSDGSHRPVTTTSSSTLSSFFPKSYISQFNASFLLGFKQPGIGLAYLGGFVARASTVGVSLFIPLYVNQYYKYSGLCDKDVPGSPSHILETGLGEIKKSCPKAYIVASILTGAAQLTALCFAPIFGYFSAKSKRHNVPLLSAALAGIIGYIFLTLLPTPQIRGPGGSPVIFAAMALVGISQIGSIVCSLAGLSAHVLGPDHYQEAISCHHEPDGRQTNSTDHAASETFLGTRDHVSDEGSALLPKPMSPPSANGNNLVHLKGSVAGMYSLCGGAGILLLTKVGGLLSDRISPKSPFYLLAGFNGLLLIFGVVISVLQRWNHRKNT
ncbi:MFS transporter [Histoplasma capsulatum var. duboisii H88]|uniref:MFS transporter n=1 Tax=Ajellomyces capsulatus (strain H88) TaxID=544711 RepID=F0UEF1_AJEC8|nr:MFS transporter [Histoplasma capsulatum var. duboisii H88]QSS55451.1 MFS transporter [Histoplasma capsulatum var. duboisii H88]